MFACRLRQTLCWSCCRSFQQPRPGSPSLARSELEELVAARVDGICSLSPSSPQDGLHTCHGELFSEAVSSVNYQQQQQQLVAVGVNCSDPGYLEVRRVYGLLKKIFPCFTQFSVLGERLRVCLCFPAELAWQCWRRWPSVCGVS